MHLHITFLVVVAIFGADAIIEQTTISPDIQNCFNNRARTTDITRSVGANINWKCVQMYVWKLVDHSSLNITISDRQWIDDITSMPVTDNSGRKKRQAHNNLRVRREYRRMTAQQRENYHRAVNLLKRIPIGNTNRYDFLANIHRGDAIPLAHEGPNFLGWHRVYLVIYENALRDVVPGVTIPYWASSLDSELPAVDQTRSAIWSKLFLGNGDGFVTKGPFANWITPSGPLTRNIGLLGELFSNDMIDKILNQTHTFQITSPNATDDTNLERLYDAVFMWIGGGNGQMNDFNTGAQDPVFYNVHAFVDHIWEKFRKKQTALDIEPSQDYPSVFGDPKQSPNEPMRFGNLLNIDGYSNYFTSVIYTYEAIPTCTKNKPTCQSDFLRCDTTSAIARCIALKKDEIPEIYKKIKQQTASKDKIQDYLCGSYNISRGLQNNYLIGRDVDIRNWVYFPVDIIHRRPPDIETYSSYPVFNGQPVTVSDVYSPSSYVGLGSTIPMGNPAVYKHCKNRRKNYDQIFLESVGLNYFGTYKEYTIVDNRLAFSHYTGYVAVRSPDYGTSKAFLSAHDFCGRMCKPYCKDFQRSSKQFVPCSGAISVIKKKPYQYSLTYGKTILDTWDFPVDGTSPEPNADPYIRFFCDYTDRWPWIPVKPLQNIPTVKQQQQQRQQNAKVQKEKSVPKSQGGSTPEKKPSDITSPSTNTSSSDLNNKSNVKEGCLLGYGCVVGIRCGPCDPGIKLACLNSTTLFAMCTGDVFMIRKCIGSSRFDVETGTCQKYNS